MRGLERKPSLSALCLTMSPNPDSATDSSPHSDLPSRVAPTLCFPSSRPVPTFGRNDLRILNPQTRGLRDGEGGTCPQGTLLWVHVGEPSCHPSPHKADRSSQQRTTVHLTPESGSGVSEASLLQGLGEEVLPGSQGRVTSKAKAQSPIRNHDLSFLKYERGF